MNVDISICPTSLTFPNGDTYNPDRLLDGIKKFILKRHPHANFENLQISYHQGGWAKIDGCSDLGNELLTEFFEKHGSDDNLFESVADYLRENIQNDLITLLDSQFGEVEYIDEVKDLACQIVVDNFKKNDGMSIKESIQNDLITLLDSQFGEVEYIDEVKDLACQIVVDRYRKFHQEENNFKQGGKNE